MAQVIRFPIERVERDNCPRCGKINGAFRTSARHLQHEVKPADHDFVLEKQ